MFVYLGHCARCCCAVLCRDAPCCAMLCRWLRRSLCRSTCLCTASVSCRTTRTSSWCSALLVSTVSPWGCLPVCVGGGLGQGHLWGPVGGGQLRLGLGLSGIERVIGHHMMACCLSPWPNAWHLNQHQKPCVARESVFHNRCPSTVLARPPTHDCNMAATCFCCVQGTIRSACSAVYGRWGRSRSGSVLTVWGLQQMMESMQQIRSQSSIWTSLSGC
jgi:hypothetical protein